jgi:hypothetical protein
MNNLGIRYNSIVDAIIDDFYILSDEFSFEEKFPCSSDLKCKNSFQDIYFCSIELLFVYIKFPFILEINKRIGIFFIFFYYTRWGSDLRE